MPKTKSRDALLLWCQWRCYRGSGQEKCGLILSHHRYFQEFKKLTGHSMTERIIATAIRRTLLFIQCIPTWITRWRREPDLCEKLAGKPFHSKENDGILKKLLHLPVEHAIRSAGHISMQVQTYRQYDQCSLMLSQGVSELGQGQSFRWNVGECILKKDQDRNHLSCIFAKKCDRHFRITSLWRVAYDIIRWEWIQAGRRRNDGELKEAMAETDFLQLIKQTLNIPVIGILPFLAKR